MTSRSEHNIGMRIGIPVSALLAVALLTACTQSEPPVLGEPKPMALRAGEGTLGSRFSQGPDGTVLVSWMRREEQGATLRFSKFERDKWSSAVDVVTDEHMFVNWADLPSVTPLNAEHWVAHWLSKSAPDTYAYDVLVAFSRDNGANWGEPLRPHTDGTHTEHGFVSVWDRAGSAALLWLDGRKTGNDRVVDDPKASSMTLRAASIAPDGSLSDEQLVDGIVCDCCQTDIAVSTDGPIAVYRNRTTKEIRDIYVTRFTDGAWVQGVSLRDDGWEIAGCPVNGPSIDADGDFVAIAWFSAANDTPVVRVALSTNSGRTFKEPIEIAVRKTSGHVGIAIIDRQSAAVSWVEKDKRGTNAINVRTVTSSGSLGPVHTVGRSNLLRIYPQLVRAADKLLLAWTDEIGDTTEVVSVMVPIPGFYDR